MIPIRTIAARLLALAFAVVFVFGASVYPFQKTPLWPILLLHAILIWWRPQLCLFTLPVLLPVLDLAPWTGWFFLEEIDLLLLSTAALVYWRMAQSAPLARLSFFSTACIAGFSLASLIGLYKGLQPLQALDVNAFASYASSYNSLRVGKSWFWALLLLPILQRCCGARLVNIKRYFIPGMLTGLALVGSFDVWERMLFPGLLNFSSDYRTTAPFSSMHTGGAALDGYLALSFPFLASCWLLQPEHLKAGPASGWTSSLSSSLASSLPYILLALGGYAGLTTFSRGVFAAYACSALLIAGFCLMQTVRQRVKHQSQRMTMMPRLITLLITLLIIYALVLVFFSSGYRGFAAVLLLLLAAAWLSTQTMAWKLLPAALLCALSINIAAGAIVSMWETAPGLAKPPYLLFMLACLVFGVLALMQKRNNISLLIAFMCMAFNALWIAFHWGGAQALVPAGGGVALAVTLIGMNTLAKGTLWRADRSSLALAAACAIGLALVIPISASYYATERFASSASDLQTRLRHWVQVKNMMDDTWATQLFGMGLGKFPISYFWRNPVGDIPGSFTYISNPSYLKLTAPHYSAGYGAALRLLQRLPIQPDRKYLLSLDIRRPDDKVALSINICQRLLLYSQNCISAPLAWQAPGPIWRHYAVLLDSGSLGAGGWLLRAPVQLEIAAQGGPSSIDIGNLSLRQLESGTKLTANDLIRNGSFDDGNSYWFFSSDHQHLPWHIKNLELNIFFELGGFGLATFFCLLIHVFTRLLQQARIGNARSAICFSAIAGFLVVGLFDSLLDVPRVSLLFFLVLLMALMQPVVPVSDLGGA